MDAGPTWRRRRGVWGWGGGGGANGSAGPSPRQQIINGTASTGKARTVMLKISGVAISTLLSQSVTSFPSDRPATPARVRFTQLSITLLLRHLSTGCRPLLEYTSLAARATRNKEGAKCGHSSVLRNLHHLHLALTDRSPETPWTRTWVKSKMLRRLARRARAAEGPGKEAGVRVRT